MGGAANIKEPGLMTSYYKIDVNLHNNTESVLFVVQLPPRRYCLDSYAAFTPGLMSPGNMYPGPATCIRIHIGDHMSTDTCRRIQVARPGYLSTVSRRHNYYSFMSRSTCIPLYPATDGRQAGDKYRHIDGDNWIYNLYSAT